MDTISFVGGVLVGVLVATISDFLRPWVHRLNQRLARWLDIRGYERDRADGSQDHRHRKN